MAFIAEAVQQVYLQGLVCNLDLVIQLNGVQINLKPCPGRARSVFFARGSDDGPVVISGLLLLSTDQQNRRIGQARPTKYSFNATLIGVEPSLLDL